MASRAATTIAKAARVSRDACATFLKTSEFTNSTDARSQVEDAQIREIDFTTLAHDHGRAEIAWTQRSPAGIAFATMCERGF